MGDPRPDQELAIKRAALAEVRRRRERAAQNLALAEDESQYKAMGAVFEELRGEEQKRDAEVREQVREATPKLDVEAEIIAAMACLDDLDKLAGDPTNLGAVGESFRRLNVRLFLSFREERQKKRVLNRISAGVLTFGTTTPQSLSTRDRRVLGL